MFICRRSEFFEGGGRGGRIPPRYDRGRPLPLTSQPPAAPLSRVARQRVDPPARPQLVPCTIMIRLAIAAHEQPFLGDTGSSLQPTRAPPRSPRRLLSPCFANTRLLRVVGCEPPDAHSHSLPSPIYTAARSAARRGTGSGSAGWFPQRDCSAATSTWRRQHHTPRRAGGKSIERAAGFGFWRHAAPRPLLGRGGARVRGQREGEQPEQRTSLHLGHQYRTQRGWPSRETPEHPTGVTYGGRDTARCRLAATGAPATGAPDSQHPRSLAIHHGGPRRLLRQQAHSSVFSWSALCVL